MSLWLLLTIPGTLLLLSGMLYLSALAEERLLSPRSLILSTVRARGASPEYAEVFVARQFERLLREYQP